MQRPAVRPDFVVATSALTEAGGLADTPVGRSSYHDFLAWQAAGGPAGKNAADVNLGRGWGALGGAEFKEKLIDDHGISAECRAWEESGADEVRERRWHQALERALVKRDLRVVDVRSGRKSASWKLAIAAWLKSNCDARTRWMAEALSLGVPAALSRNLTHYRRHLQRTDETWRRLTSLSAASGGFSGGELLASACDSGDGLEVQTGGSFGPVGSAGARGGSILRHRDVPIRRLSSGVPMTHCVHGGALRRSGGFPAAELRSADRSRATEQRGTDDSLCAWRRSPTERPLSSRRITFGRPVSGDRKVAPPTGRSRISPTRFAARLGAGRPILLCGKKTWAGRPCHAGHGPHLKVK